MPYLIALESLWHLFWKQKWNKYYLDVMWSWIVLYARKTLEMVNISISEMTMCIMRAVQKFMIMVKLMMLSPSQIRWKIHCWKRFWFTLRIFSNHELQRKLSLILISSNRSWNSQYIFSDCQSVQHLPTLILSFFLFFLKIKKRSFWT